MSMRVYGRESRIRPQCGMVRGLGDFCRALWTEATRLPASAFGTLNDSTMKSPNIDFAKIFSREIETFFDIHQLIPEEENFARTKAAIDAFHELFMELAKELRIKDGWSEGFAHIAPFSTGIIERSDKISCDFTMAVGLDGFMMDLPLANSWAVRHMGNEFWSLISSLANLGKASLSDHGRPRGLDENPNNDRLIKNNNGLVFSIARDYIFWEQSGEPGFSVGTINLVVPLETPFKDVRAFYKEGLRLSYRANYLLFRQAYQIRKAQERHFLKSYNPSPEDNSD